MAIMNRKNVLILSASPRKGGNSDTLCAQFAKGAREMGHNVETVRLYQEDIGFCRACYGCWDSGECVLHDGMGAILAKMQAAEVIVVATPVYFSSMNGMLKATIDRFLPKWKDLGGHDVYLIVTGHDGREGLKPTADELARIFASLGNSVKGIVWGERVWQKGEVTSTKAMDEAYRAGVNA